MTRQAAIAKREKSLAEQVIIVLLLAALMAVFVYYFFKHEQQLTETGFASLSGNFISKLALIRSEWYMQGRPATLTLSESDAEGNVVARRKVTINRQGWVVSSDDSLPCQHIWQMVMDTPLMFMKQPIAAVAVQRSEAGNLCRYGIASGQAFEYYPATGKVQKSPN